MNVPAGLPRASHSGCTQKEESLPAVAHLQVPLWRFGPHDSSSRMGSVAPPRPSS